MSNKFKIFFIVFICAVINGIIGIDFVYADSTVLYDDGTLIINELDEDRGSNLTKHGEITKEYEPLGENNSYNFIFTDTAGIQNTNTILWKNEWDLIKNVEIGQKIFPTSTAYWFLGCENLVKADFTNLDTSNVTTMQAMFDNAALKSTSIELIGLENWDTSKVTTMRGMFSSFAPNVKNFVPIGKLKIPANCNLDYFLLYSSKFKGEFELYGIPSIKEDFNYGVADVTIYYTNNRIKKSAKQMAGKGIKVISSYTYNVSVITNSGDNNLSPLNVHDEEKAEFTLTPETGYMNPVVSCTNNQEAIIDDNVLTINSVTNDTVCTVNYEFKKIVTDISFDKNSYVYTGQQIIPNIEIKYGDTILEQEVDYVLEYDNNINVGDATISIDYKNDYFGDSNKTFKIVPMDINNCEIAALEDKTYTGNAIVQNIKVNNDSVTLTSDNYDVNYKNNKYVGTATVTITGKGNYTGEISKTFDIKPADISDYTVTGIVDKTYTGEPIYQQITVSKGNIILTSDDYTITYLNNKISGTATIFIYGKGNYTGEIRKKFEIKPIDISSYSVEHIEDKIYTGKRITQNIKVMNGNNELNSNYYYIVYSNNINVGTAEIMIEGRNSHVGFIKRTFKINPKNIADLTINKIENKTYTGNPITQDLEIIHDGKSLALDDYYTIYDRNINAGIATLKIIGKGNYGGSATRNFYIHPKVITDNDVTIIGMEDKIYNGKQQAQSFMVIVDDRVLQNGVDYCSYVDGDQVNVGEPWVVINFDCNYGNYSGTIEKTFKINPIKIDNGNVKVTGIVNKVFNNKNQTQSIKVTYNGNNVPVELSYKNNKNIGIATVTITAYGNYTGAITKTFIINPSKVTISSIKSSKKRITVKHGMILGGVKYQIAYKQKGTSKWKYVNTTKSSVKIKKLKSKKKYFVKIRAYRVINKVTYYGDWSSLRKIKVK